MACNHGNRVLLYPCVHYVSSVIAPVASAYLPLIVYCNSGVISDGKSLVEEGRRVVRRNSKIMISKVIKIIDYRYRFSIDIVILICMSSIISLRYDV